MWWQREQMRRPGLFGIICTMQKTWKQRGATLRSVTFIKRNIPPWVFFACFKLFKWCQIVQSNKNEFKENSHRRSKLWRSDMAHKILSSFAYIFYRFSPIFHFYNPWKRQETRRFHDVFRGSRNGAMDQNGLKLPCKF